MLQDFFKVILTLSYFCSIYQINMNVPIIAKTEYCYKVTFNLNPQLLIIPIIKISSVFNNFKFLAEFNLPIEEHRHNCEKEICLLYLIVLIKNIYLYQYIPYELNEYLLEDLIIVKTAEKLADDYNRVILIFKGLPQFVCNKIIGTPLNEANLYISEINYLGIGIWLEYWHLKKPTDKLKENISISWLEPDAFLTLKRYELIYELRNKKKLFLNHNLIWLLTEISILIARYKCNASSRENIYKSRQEYLNYLSYSGEIPPKHYGKKEDIFYHMYKFIDTLASEVASKDKDFDKKYFKPYINACKSTNSYMKKELVLVNPAPKTKQERPNGKKPGGAIGHKKKRRKK